jgi:flagellar biosynthesis/type III secretory pathway M-ring protein FliF/YscJ
VLAGGAFVALLVAFVALAYALQAGGSELFARPLDVAQLAEVQERLAAWDVHFRTTADNVTVDPAHKSELLLRLAMVGVPHEHVTTSADTLKSVNALTPESVLDAQVRQGLEGDLAEGLRGITGIVDARVLIAPAVHGYFVDEASHDASASVRVTLDHDAALPPEAVAGIRSYVANSVPGLAAEHVTIVDQNGIALDANPASGGAEDKPLERTLQAALDTVVGPGETLVLAHLENSRQSSTSREVKRTPLLDSPLSSEAVREHYSGKDKSYDKVRQNSDRGSDTLESSVHVDAGVPLHRSVAVFVDEHRATMIPRITEVMLAAAGLVPTRGDTLVVRAVDFAKAPGVPKSTPEPLMASLGVSVPALVIGLAAILAFVLVSRPLVDLLKHQTETAMLEDRRSRIADFEPVRIHAALRGEPAHTAAALLASLPSSTTAAVLEMYDEDVRREISARLTKTLSPIVRDVSVQAGSV